MPRHEIHVGGQELVFSAGHFIAFEGGASEHLHGHNYQVSATIRGPLREKGYVVDFVAVRDRLREILSALDHRLLLPEESPWFTITRGGGAVEVEVGDRAYRFPEEDVAFVPVDNTTSENLSAHLLDRLVDALPLDGSAGPVEVALRLEELPGQGATSRRTLEPAPGG